TDDRVAVGHRRHEREVLADFDAGHVGARGPEGAADVAGCVQLQVPGIEMPGAADKEQQDTVDVSSPAGHRFESAEVGEREADGPGGQGAGAKEVAPRQAVAELDTLLGLELEHGTSPSGMEWTTRAGFILAAGAGDATGNSRGPGPSRVLRSPGT